MKTPPFLLTDTVEVEPFVGSTAFGSRYGQKTEVRCHLETRRRVLVAADGSDVISDSTLWTTPEHKDVLAPQSRVILEGRKTTVVERRVHKDLAGPAEIEAVLGTSSTRTGVPT